MALGQGDLEVGCIVNSSVVMDGLKPNPGKKVRFDLNHEVFFIPTKWDRLSSQTSVIKEKVIGEVAIRTRTRVEDERRAKNKQNKSKKARKSTRSRRIDVSTAATVTRADRNKGTLSSRGSTAKESNGGSKVTQRTDKSTSVGNQSKLPQRERGDIDKVDIVLPKIGYSTEIKRAIEKVLVRNRTFTQDIDNNKDPVKTIPNKEDNASLSRTRSVYDNDSLSSDKKDPLRPMISYRSVPRPDGEVRFSELSRNLDGWTPFSAWRESAEGESTDGKRGAGPLIPHSILY
ncbi:predicted protein [Nematostella vectensis]|uniref:Uncharacterized protein n=1 Tax=Nematostella vectensis TaxID=45351 RepID=A7REQ9_NEMVE|nr:uncharacterized protein LOC5522149 [Nematostella vectensis]EDO49957.1 predicted protein [Nematostella vectensis]|eukprot:XP_001642020.1 predicted protein [Nematostella vectensis]